MKAMTRSVFLAACVAGAPLLAQQQPLGAPGGGQPTTRESRFGGERRPFNGGGGGGGGVPRMGMGLSDRDREDATAFMKQFAPNRWAAMEAMRDGGDRAGAMVFALARWRHLQFLREEDQELYDIKVRQLVAEDAIFGLLASTRTPADRVPLRKDIREKAADLVRLGLAEREHRIAKLREEIKAEEERVAKDRTDMDSLIDRRTDSLITDGPVASRPDGGPRRPRGRDGATTRPDGPPPPHNDD